VKPIVRTVKSVFDHALELATDAERRAYLDEACAGNPGLRQKVEALLRADAEAGSFLGKPAAPPTAETSPGEGGPGSTGPYQPGNTPADQSSAEPGATGAYQPADAAAPPAEGAGTRLGPYRLLEEIGHGGMGAVYLAEQEEPVRRRVALKLIKAGMDSEQVVARFEAERQALALMDHLNIAKVLDAGATAEGVPYFVMELVQGVPLTKYCDEHRLTVRERLELFVPVCQAIQHAHQKGIIHRDIKPSNVLVTQHEGRPFPKVIDFGIAKAVEQPLTEGSPQTQAGMIVGTLEYMSPEQADTVGRDIDTRSDVYSLGVLLYELLTGTPPIDRARLRKTPLLEVLRVIAEEEAVRPSARVRSLPGEEAAKVAARRQTEPAKLARLLRGDLDWITAKALEKDRERRYESAADLARDVRRCLADEPVEAGPPTAGYRLRKFARKHRLLLITAGAGMVLLGVTLVGLGVAFIQWERGRLAKAAEIQAEQRKLEALDMTDGVVQAMIDNSNKLGDTEKDMLRAVLRLYQSMETDLGDTEVARATAAERQFRMANIAQVMTDYGTAEAGYREAIQGYEALAKEFPQTAGYRKELARSHYNRGILHLRTGNAAEAEPFFRQAATLYERLIVESPDQPVYRRSLANDLNNLGVALRRRHQPAAAAEACRRAIEVRAKLIADFPDSSDRSLNEVHLAAGYGNLANLVRDEDGPAAALPWYDKAIELLDPIHARGQVTTARVFLHNVHWDRAHALMRLGRHADAIKDWQRAIELDEGRDRNRLKLFQDTAREEERLKAPPPEAGEVPAGGRFYAAARLFAAAAGAAAPDEQRLSTYYAGRALELLEQARAAGFFRETQRIEELKKDLPLKALGQRPEFQKFVAGLQAAEPPK
jgi:serine/threonine protein kinase